MSFQQGLSGLNSSAKHLDTIGNNVANASTVGFKQSQAQFADMFAVSLAGGNAVQIGTGTKVAAVMQQFTQGNITNTNNPMDHAISGQGFFRVIDPNGAILYSRNGQFQVDKSGFIVTNQGHKVTGYMPDPVTGIISTASPQPLQISAADLLPKQTSNLAAGGVPVGVGLNLDSRATFATGLVQGALKGSAGAPTSLTVAAPVNEINVWVDGIAAGAPITIPAQAYASASTLATAVQQAINADVTLQNAGKSVTVTADANGILSITSNSVGPGSSVAALDSVAGAGTIAQILGTPTTTAGSGQFSPLDPTTYNNSTSLTVFDSLGTSHIASLYFQKVDANTWNTYMTIDGALTPAAAATTADLTAAVTAGTSSTLTVPSTVGLAVGDTVTIAGAGANGVDLTATISAVDTVNSTLTFSPAVDAAATNVAATVTKVPLLTTLKFDTLGQLVAPAANTAVAPPLAMGQVTSATFNPPGAKAMNLTFDFANSSQYGGTFGVNSLTQDGYTSGRLNGFSTAADGTIQGRYSNGQTRAMGQMLLANFTNPQGLQPVGNNEWVETAGSGGPLVGVPGSASLGLLQSSATEDSNVDLTAELVNMITAQRVYQANAQTIKAQDQVLQTLVNLR